LLVPVALLAYSVLVPLDAPVWIPCTFKTWTGLPCPFCGMTRSFTRAGHGDWSTSIAESPLGFVLFTICLLLVGLGLLAILRKSSFGVDWEGRGKQALLLAALLVLANWIYRLVRGLY
jgi:hypothetical protein